MFSNLVLISKNSVLNFKLNITYLLDFIFISIISFYGTFSIGFQSFNSILNSEDCFIISQMKYSILKNLILKKLYLLCFCWSSCFELIGYNFGFRKQLKKNIINFNLGYSKHSIFLVLPNKIKLLGRKRKFVVFSSCIRVFFLLTRFLAEVRNIFPYKKRGLVPDQIFKNWLKPGKKTKNK